MSRTDVIIQGYLFAYGIPLFYFALVLMIMVKNFKSVKDKLFSNYVSKCDKAYEEVTKDHKKSLFAPLHTLVSSNWKLKNEGLIRILEIGVRTGQNLKYYPKNSHVIAVDCNTHLEHYFKADYKKVNNLTIEKFISSHGENLREIPDNSVDTVIATLVLCSAVNVDQVLREIWRVLVPGGTYYFLEHVYEQRDPSLRRKQNLLSITKIWPYAFDGCHLNRNTEINIKLSKFKDVKYKYLELQIKNLYPLKFVKTHIIGTAIK